MSTRRRGGLAPRLERLEDLVLLSTFTPAQIRHAYGVDTIHFTGANGQPITGDGSGQTIAIVDAYHDGNLASNLQTFDKQFGLPNPTLTQAYYGTQSNDGWAVEESLDVEWAHAIAPGAKILVVEAKTSGFDDLMTAVNYARQQTGVVAVSMSWGGGEFSGESQYDSTFTTPSGHAGVTFLAATGDSGASGGVEYPSASPNVVAVGGTSLTVDAYSNYVSEAAWSGGGGGYSTDEGEPTFQTGTQSSGVRTVPDVSMDADPNTGLYVYSTAPSNGRGGWYYVGGTSASTPMWAGLIAVADQGRSIAGKTSLDGPSQTLPALYGASLNNAFHDITTGSNGYAATAGYDLATGRGTPKAGSLVIDLVQVANAPARGSTPVGGGSAPSIHLGSFAEAKSTVAVPETTPSEASPTFVAPPAGDVAVAISLVGSHSGKASSAVHDAALALVAQGERRWFV